MAKDKKQDKKPETATNAPLAPVADAVSRLEDAATVAINAHLTDEQKREMLARIKAAPRPLIVTTMPESEALAARVRALAAPGESLVQAVERLEALAKRVVDAERERDEARAEVERLSFDKGVLLSANESALNSPLRALEGEHRVAGVIVEDVEGGKHRVHVLERGEDKALTLWTVERGEAMPWHAAKVLVERVVETKVTPEDKR